MITTVSACALILLFGFDVSGATINPYTGMLILVGLPGLFVFGLLLIPIGILIHRKRGGATPPPIGEAVGALFTTSQGRRRLWWIAGLTVVNILLLGAASQRLLAWTSQPNFCGTACHGVMEPEWESYHDASHANVACVECHVGSGAKHLVRSKLDGLRQVWKTMIGSYEKPVKAPVHSMRPSEETCEKCHWPDRWDGNRAKLFAHTASDEKNTELVNVLRLKVGGVHPATGKASGFHWHAAKGTEVRYEVLDEARTLIGKVQVVRDGKVVEEFLPPAGEAKPVLETREMDCIDCHNRPTHRFDAAPAAALDRAFTAGLLDRGVPFLRELSPAVLEGVKGPRDGVEAPLRAALQAAYEQRLKDAVPPSAALDAAAKGLATIWRDNVFPDRGVTWGTYPSHQGHQSQSPALHGCFRCHDDKHKTAAGKALSGECEVCHEVLAQDEKRADLDKAVRELLGLD